MADYNVTVSLGGGPTPTGWHIVTAYGAVGDGTTDDTAAIQAAITAAGAAGGGEVFVPSGSYAVTALTMPSDGVTLRGTGRASKLIAATTSTIYTLTMTGDNCVVDGITFVGGVSTEIANYCIYLGPCDGCSIRNCLFTGTSASAGYNTHIRGGVATNFSIVGNVFERVNGTGSGHGHGITMAACTDGIISGNIGTQTATQGRHHVYLNAATDGCARVVISDNKFTGGTSAQITIYTGTSTAGLSDIIIANNILVNAGAPSTSEAALEFVGYVTNSKAIGNIITNAEGNGIKLETAAANSCDRISIVGNRIDVCGGYGIINSGAAGANITGNTVKDAGSTENADAIKIETKYSDPDNSVICGNIVLGSSHRYGVSIAGDKVVVSGNSVSTGTAGPALLYFGAGEYQDELTRISSGDDTTPSVADARVLRINGNTNPTELTQLDSAVANQTVTIVNTLANNPVTIADAGNFVLNGAWGGSQYSTITLWTPDGTTWIERSRSNNAYSPSVLTAADGDATPTVLGAKHLLIPANTAPTAITQLDDSVAGQQVTIVATNATNPSTLADGATFILAGGAAWAPGIDDTITLFTANGGASAVWREICRSDN